MNSTLKKAPIAENSLVFRLDMVLKPPAILAWIGRRLKNEPIMWLGGPHKNDLFTTSRNDAIPSGGVPKRHAGRTRILPGVILHIFLSWAPFYLSNARVQNFTSKLTLNSAKKKSFTGDHSGLRHVAYFWSNFERAQRLGVSRNRKIARKMKKSYEISIVFALGKVDVVIHFFDPRDFFDLIWCIFFPNFVRRHKIWARSTTSRREKVRFYRFFAKNDCSKIAIFESFSLMKTIGSEW